jgi:hypothetical protein
VVAFSVPNGFGTPAASQAGSASAAASHARVAQDDIENVGWRASQTNLSASQRAETVQREMAARLEHIAAPLDGALPLGAANHNPTHIGEGMLDDLEELYQEAKAAKK